MLPPVTKLRLSDDGDSRSAALNGIAAYSDLSSANINDGLVSSASSHIAQAQRFGSNSSARSPAARITSRASPAASVSLVVADPLGSNMETFDSSSLGSRNDYDATTALMPTSTVAAASAVPSNHSGSGGGGGGRSAHDPRRYLQPQQTTHYGFQSPPLPQSSSSSNLGLDFGTGSSGRSSRRRSTSMSTLATIVPDRLLHAEPRASVWGPVIIVVVLMIVFGVIIGTHAKAIFLWLENISTDVKESGLVGMLLVTSFISITAFPPMFGYSTATLFAGWVWGWPLGFIPVFVGALSGSVACFIMSRKYGSRYMRRLLNMNKRVAAAVRAVERKGVNMLLLIRLAPYPFNITNALLGGTSISLWHFTVATAVSLIKVNIHVYIGAHLQSLTGGIGNGEHKALEIVTVVIGVALAVGIAAYLFVVTDRMVKESGADLVDELEDAQVNASAGIANNSNNSNSNSNINSNGDDSDVAEATTLRSSPYAVAIGNTSNLPSMNSNGEYNNNNVSDGGTYTINMSDSDHTTWWAWNDDDHHNDQRSK